MSTKMKATLWITAALVVLGSAYALYTLVLQSHPEAFTPLIVDSAGSPIPGGIAVIETVTLGGVEQTITIRGVNTSNPVLLFLHGGPGMPSSPWATWNGYHAELEAHFVLVHWDQRGAGMDFSRQTIGMEVIEAGFDLAADYPTAAIPIHFLHGRYDYATPGEFVETYSNLLEAPEKSFTWFEHSAHDIYYDEAGKFNQTIIRIAQDTLSRSN